MAAATPMATATPVAAATLVAAATPAPTAAPLPAGTRAEDRDVNVSLSEWKLQPSRTKVPAGSIRFLAENIGTTQHALRISRLDCHSHSFRTKLDVNRNFGNQF